MICPPTEPSWPCIRAENPKFQVHWFRGRLLRRRKFGMRQHAYLDNLGRRLDVPKWVFRCKMGLSAPTPPLKAVCPDNALPDIAVSRAGDRPFSSAFIKPLHKSGFHLLTERITEVHRSLRLRAGVQPGIQIYSIAAGTG